MRARVGGRTHRRSQSSTTEIIASPAASRQRPGESTVPLLSSALWWCHDNRRSVGMKIKGLKVTILTQADRSDPLNHLVVAGGAGEGGWGGGGRGRGGEDGGVGTGGSN